MRGLRLSRVFYAGAEELGVQKRCEVQILGRS